MTWFDTRLSIWGDDLDPVVVDEIYGVAADHSWRKGQEHNRPDGGGPSYQKTGYWSVSTEHRILGDDPEAHIQYLIDLVENGLHAETIREMTDKIAIDITVQSEEADDETGSWEGHLSPLLLSRIGKAGAVLRLTFLFNNPLI